MKSNVYVLWSNGKISIYQFDNSGSNLKYRWKQYCQSIKNKSGRILDPHDENDSVLIEKIKTAPN